VSNHDTKHRSTALIHATCRRSHCTIAIRPSLTDPCPRCSSRPYCDLRRPLRSSCVMRPLRYSINVTLDGCCDHREGIADEDLHRHAAENIAQADALLFGRVTYEMMEAAWRGPARTGERPDWMEPWMEPFARTTNAAKKYVVSSTLDRVDWNAELVRGDLGKAVQQLKQEPGKGLCSREA